MSFEITLDWDLASGEEEAAPQGAESTPDALVRSLRELGRVDMGYIADRIGTSEAEAARLLGDSVYLDPYTMDWVSSEEYLSGNLVRKLEVAIRANRATGSFGRNIKALREALPPRVPTEAIYAPLGAPWLPASVIRDFVSHLMCDPNCPCEVLHDSTTGSWDIRGKGRYRLRPESRRIWGTTRMQALDIVEATLNGRPVRVTDEVPSPATKSGTKRVPNHDETLMAIERQQLICREFETWLWSDPERSRELEDLYNSRYCGWVPRRYDGSVLDFPGMSDGMALRPYQRDTVLRVLANQDVLVAHDVGAGKTYTAIAAIMELRRMGISSKNLVVVPNNVMGQWASLFTEMYPGADVLVVLPQDFHPERRQAALAEIRDGDHDAVLMASSSFDLIPHSKDEALRAIDARIRELDKALGDPSRSTAAAKRERGACVKRREKVKGEKAAAGITFDQLGVTRLFVDECHAYKNLRIGSGFRSGGLSRSGSKKCEHMLTAVRCVQRGGGGAVFLTGTVITNSIADLYVFQTYLQPGTLSLLDIRGFEAWCGLFARKTTALEVDVDTSTFHYAARFTGFCNLAELSSVLGTVTDFHRLGPADGLPARDGHRDILVRKGRDLEAYLKEISRRADRVRAGRVSAKDDNLLKICSDGRRAALDTRLVCDGAVDGATSKVVACAEIVHRIWADTAQERLTQLVFCDISTPRAGFNVYDELKRALVRRGVPAEEVAFVHDARTEADRARLFAAVRAGDVRVLVGSTQKLGVGVNVQDRLVSAHHLDVPWRASDMVQREGRILRQGNRNARVEVYRYVTEGSFDAFSYQLLEAKQAIVDGLLSATYEGRAIDQDVGDVALSYGEVKALAVNNPLLKKRVETANELQRSLIIHRRSATAREEMRAEISEKVSSIEHLEAELVHCREDIEHLSSAAGARPGKEARNLVRRMVPWALARNAFQAHETVLPNCRYRGFAIVLPALMDPEEPYLWLERGARHRVDLDEMRELGIVPRFDHVLEGIGERMSGIEVGIEELYRSWQVLEGQLADMGADQTAKIRQLKALLARIDIELEEAKNEDHE